MAKFADLYRAIDLPQSGYRQAKRIEDVLGDWLVTEDEQVCIITTDHTRPLDPAQAVRELFRRIDADIQVIIGLGLHRTMNVGELETLEEFSPVQHDPDRVSSLQLSSGEKVGLSSVVLASKWAISVGVAELHQYAGVSGGYKGLTVGCGSRALIGALHSRDMVCDPSVQLGKVDGNRFRERIDQIGRDSGCALALNFVPATGDWLFGIPDRVTKRARELLDPWVVVPRRYQGIRLVVPPSKGGSFYQASRAATYLALSPHPALVEGGTIEIVANCEEGIGSEAGFVRALQTHRPPWQSSLEGEEPNGAGAQRIFMLARMAQRFRLRIVGAADPSVFWSIGIDAQKDVPELEKNWLVIQKPFYKIPQVARG